MTFKRHCIQIPCDHKQTMWIGPSGYDSVKFRRQQHRRHCHTSSHEYHNVEQIPPYHNGNGV